MLRLEEVSKVFGGLVAVDGLSFHVSEGEIVGIIGPNGAGKSTVLNVISGFYRPSRGRVMFRGEDITKLRAPKVAQLGVGRNFQASVLFGSLPVIESVFTAYHMAYKTAKWKRVLRLASAREEERNLRQRAAELLETMGLGAFKGEIAGSLPHGHQRMLGVCMAMATNPKLLLLDEPMTGMNEGEVREMALMVRRIRDNGTTVLMIEHNVGAMMSLCDRVVVLDRGEKIAEGLPGEIVRNTRVIDAYLGQPQE